MWGVLKIIMKIKKIFVLLIIFTIINSFIFANPGFTQEELDEIEKEEMVEKGFQTVDNLKSTYKIRSWDGFSWKERENKYDVNDTILSKEKLLSVRWICECESSNTWFTSYLVFFKDDVFKFGFKDTGVLVSGKYKIEDNKILLYEYNPLNEEKLKADIYAKLSFFDGSVLPGSFLADSNNVIYENELQFEKISFYPQNVYRQKSKKVLINDISVVTCKETSAITKAVTFYSLPDINSEKRKITIYEEQYKIKPDSFVIPGMTVIVCGRTENKEKIDGITDYWYFIKFYDDELNTYYGWIFSACFEPYNKDKQYFYKEMMQKYAEDKQNS